MKCSSSTVQPMLTAKRRTSRLSQETSLVGYSKPTPGPDMIAVEMSWRVKTVLL